MRCDKCLSEAILSVNGKVDDRVNMVFQNKEHHGSVEGVPFIGSGDYLKFSVCLTCGIIQYFPGICQPDWAIEKGEED